MLTPSHPLSRPLGLPVCLARLPAARLWLKDESLEDSANLPDPDIIAVQLIRNLPLTHPSGFPSMSAAPANSIVEDLEAALSQFAAIASDLKQ